MIIDSHAHYNNNAYKKPFRYLSYDKEGYILKEGELSQLIQEMVDAKIPYSIEPGVSLQSCEEVLQLSAEYPERIFPAIGIHPTRSIFEKWSDRHKLAAYANTPGVIAIGEIGLDYHYKREEQHRLKQHLWFIYQLNLALLISTAGTCRMAANWCVSRCLRFLGKVKIKRCAFISRLFPY